jgi:hypothetical protein
MAPVRWARRFGYTLAVLINLAILYIINVFPGWDAVPFLTDATPRVLVLLNVSLLAGIAANAVYVATDGPWVKALGELTTTTIGLAVLIRAWQVFPVDFGTSSVDWGLVLRVVLAVGLVGTAVALIAQAVTLTRLAVERLGRPAGPDRLMCLAGR